MSSYNISATCLSSFVWAKHSQCIPPGLEFMCLSRVKPIFPILYTGTREASGIFSCLYQKRAFIAIILYKSAENCNLRKKHKTHRRQCKMSSSKKLTCKGTLRQVFICVRPRTPYPSPHSHYSILYFFTTGKRGRKGGNWTRKEVRGATEESIEHKAGLKIPAWLNVRIRKILTVSLQIKTCRSPFTDKFFYMTTFCIDFYESYLSTLLTIIIVVVFNWRQSINNFLLF